MTRPDAPAKESSDAKLPIVIVDDDGSVRQSTAMLLRALGHEVRFYDNGPAFLDAERGDAPFCLILDMRMTPMDGFEVFEQVKRLPATVPTLFLTGTGDIPMAVEAMRRGALDFIEKPASPQVLLDAIERAGSVFATQGTGQDAGTAPAEAPHTPLTRREQDVLDLLVQGMTNKAIGRELSISPRTVEIHRSRIKQKLSASNLAELMRYARKSRPGSVDG
ncbi:MAG: response regulator transcription factor [Alphaproteobacteria bacterium]